jgi:hypothetical protein
MYEWFDLSQIDNESVKKVYSDDLVQNLYEQMQSSQKMSELIEKKARQKNVKIIPIEADKIGNELVDAAERGDTVIPHAVTRIQVIDDDEETPAKPA